MKLLRRSEGNHRVTPIVAQSVSGTAAIARAMAQGEAGSIEIDGNGNLENTHPNKKTAARA